MFSQFFVLAPRGDVIVLKNFRGDINHRETSEVFVRRNNADKDGAPPLFTEDNIHYIHLKRGGLTLLLTTRFNVSPAVSLELLSRVARLFKDFCGVFNEEAVRKNFTLIYEIIDEVMDFGFPQLTTAESLRPHVKNETVLSDEQLADTPTGVLDQIRYATSGTQRTAASNCSNKPLTYKNLKPEVFVDVFEKLAASFSASGEVLQCFIDGHIQFKSFVPGQPRFRVGLNENLIVGESNYIGFSQPHLDDVVFHDQVRLDEFTHSRMLSFVPPEGEFDLMKYRVCRTDLQLPFRVYPYVSESNNELEVSVRVRCDLPLEEHAVSVRVRIPLPKNATVAHPEIEHMEKVPDQLKDTREQSVIWTIKKFPGQTELGLRVRIFFPTGTNLTLARKFLGPINLSFELPARACSGLDIVKLHVFDREKQITPHRWIRYVTQSNSYVVRM